MYLDWTKHLKTPKEKEDFIREVQGSRKVLEHLDALLESELKAQDQSERSVKDFEHINWAYKQAFRNGTRASMERMRILINLDQQRGI